MGRRDDLAGLRWEVLPSAHVGHIVEVLHELPNTRDRWQCRCSCGAVYVLTTNMVLQVAGNHDVVHDPRESKEHA